MRRHLDYCTAPLLAEPWILDIDTTVKPLYGHQEGAVIGYNPKKPGRPSHSYHTYSMAGVRLVLDVDVVAGNEHTSKHFAPGLWALLDRILRDLWPSLLRGDCGFGNEPIMREAEQRGLAYLFKLRLTANVKRMIERLSTQREWANTGQGWQAKESLLRLEGWSRQRRVIILRRRVKGDLAISSNETSGQQTLSFVDVGAGVDVYEYSVLATSLDEELVSFGQLYRDPETMRQTAERAGLKRSRNRFKQPLANDWKRMPNCRPAAQLQSAVQARKCGPGIDSSQPLQRSPCRCCKSAVR